MFRRVVVAELESLLGRLDFDDQALGDGLPGDVAPRQRPALRLDLTFDLSEQLRFTRPGSHLTKGGSGLGWAGGAAIGVKLATKLYDLTDRPNLKPKDSSAEPLVCMITGDGSFVFSVPTAVYWASYRHDCPFLTIVLNNGGWRATRQCIVDVHPQGVASTVTNQDLGISWEPSFDQLINPSALQTV